MRRPVRHLLHGLHIASDTPIPGLTLVDSGRPADLQVWLGTPFPSADDPGPTAAAPASVETWFEAAHFTASGEPSLKAMRLSGGHYRITYRDGMDFVIDRTASEVWVTWPSTLTVKDVSPYLLGPIIGAVLRLRGTVCLHASAIDVDGRAIAFIGPAGAGKSTTAAAFAVRGVAVLSDDTLALTESGASWIVAPGYPRVRLWPESAHALAADAGPGALLPPGQSGSTTRYHLDLMAQGHRFQRQPLPLGLVYVLEEANAGDVLDAAPLTASAALMALAGNTYGWRILDRAQRAAEFEALGRFVERVPVRRLRRPTDFARLPEFVELVLNDLATLGLAGSTVDTR